FSFKTKKRKIEVTNFKGLISSPHEYSNYYLAPNPTSIAVYAVNPFLSNTTYYHKDYFNYGGLDFGNPNESFKKYNDLLEDFHHHLDTSLKEWPSAYVPYFDAVDFSGNTFEKASALGATSFNLPAMSFVGKDSLINQTGGFYLGVSCQVSNMYLNTASGTTDLFATYRGNFFKAVKINNETPNPFSVEFEVPLARVEYKKNNSFKSMTLKITADVKITYE
ncbi:MAG: hypothetical protein AAF591_23780, partial [Verrucomicrobiota bacterium]